MADDRTINPKDEQWQKGDKHPMVLTVGEKLFAAVGSERYRAKTGSRCLSVRFVSLKDYAGTGDENKDMFENFVLEQSSMWRFVKFVNAIGYSEPFSVDSDEDIEKILTFGYVRASVKLETYQGEVSARAELWLSPGQVTEDPEWAEWISAGEERHAAYLDWRAENPRGAGGGRSGGGGGSRSGGGGGGGSAEGRSGTGHAGRGAADDGIPF